MEKDVQKEEPFFAKEHGRFWVQHNNIVHTCCIQSQNIQPLVGKVIKKIF